jgi:hypothetical protein
MNPAEGDADQGENLTAEEEAEVRRRVELEKLKRKEQVQKRREELRQKSSADTGLKTKEVKNHIPKRTRYFPTLKISHIIYLNLCTCK